MTTHPTTSLSSEWCEECEEWTTHTTHSPHYSVSREVRIGAGASRRSSPTPAPRAYPCQLLDPRPLTIPKGPRHAASL
jgi:hypothetical protein